LTLPSETPGLHSKEVKNDWADHMKKKKIPKGWKLAIQGLPLAAAAATVFLPLQRLGHQFVMLIVLVWVQVFFIVECFLVVK
jgi:hypothetical protein